MDAFLIGVAIRMATPLQRRGVPLPSIISFCMTGYLMVTGLLIALYFSLGMTIPFLFFLFVLFAAWMDARPELRRLNADSQEWGPGLHDRYKAAAGKAVLTEGPFRSIVLMFLAFAIVSAQPMLYRGYPVLTFSAIAIMLWPLAKLMELLSRCVPPIEGDAERKLALGGA